MIKNFRGKSVVQRQYEYRQPIFILADEINRLDSTIEDCIVSLPQAEFLLTIPGVSYYSALMIYAELGDISRFDDDKAVVSYVGLNPVIR